MKNSLKPAAELEKIAYKVAIKIKELSLSGLKSTAFPKHPLSQIDTCGKIDATAYFIRGGQANGGTE